MTPAEVSLVRLLAASERQAEAGPPCERLSTFANALQSKLTELDPSRRIQYAERVSTLVEQVVHFAGGERFCSH